MGRGGTLENVRSSKRLKQRPSAPTGGIICNDLRQRTLLLCRLRPLCTSSRQNPRSEEQALREKNNTRRHDKTDGFL